MDKKAARKRQAELAKMKSLIFEEERRRRRIKKIKSKSFHKVARKERERDQERLMEQVEGASL